MQAIEQARSVSVQELALRMQDEAYTFAYYLLGDESAADAATQAAFTRLAKRSVRHPDQFRQEVLRGVLIGSRKYALPASTPQEDLLRALMRLNTKERTAVVLVDVLSLDYNSAAAIMDCSRKEIGSLLAHGRLKVLPAGRLQ